MKEKLKYAIEHKEEAIHVGDCVTVTKEALKLLLDKGLNYVYFNPRDYVDVFKLKSEAWEDTDGLPEYSRETYRPLLLTGVMGYLSFYKEDPGVTCIQSREVPYGTVLGFSPDGETEPGKVYRLEVYRTITNPDGSVEQVRKG